MFKRIITLMLIVLLTAGMLPVSVCALSQQDKIIDAIGRDYAAALKDSDQESLAGYCGLFASYQLYYRGINSWMQTAHGKDHYDLYSAMTETSGGYRPSAYSRVDVSMRNALNAVCRNGTQDVYNLLVCFQWTNTEAGNQYGHVVFIYAILDGNIYFTESFALNGKYAAGDPVIMTIEEFVDYYDEWTQYEGLVVFGQKNYIENCTAYSTNLFLEAMEQADLLSQPCSVNSSMVDCFSLRTVAAGERLHATALYRNTSGQYYYKVADGEQTGYVPAAQMHVFRVNYEDIALSEPFVPEALAAGKDHQFRGEISAPYSGMEAVGLEVLDATGEMVLGYSQTLQSNAFSLDDGGFNKVLDLATLEKGYYSCGIYADCVNHYLMDDGTVASYTNRVRLLDTPFRVGDVPEQEPVREAVQPRTVPNGWVYENETWYYYENGLPRTGWFWYNGVDYYLQEDGSVTTGWAEVNGKMRCFTSTGAMRTGWLETEHGDYYLLSNGAMAQGKCTIGDSVYYFREDGTLQDKGWIDIGDQRFYLLCDCIPATGWLELEDGTFYFHADGHLVAELAMENGSAVLRAYEGPDANTASTAAADEDHTDTTTEVPAE